MADLVFGKVINVKAAADGPDVGAKIEVFIQSQHMPVDMITWFGRNVTVKDQVEKVKKLPIEEEADRQRERDDARKFEGLADMPTDKSEPRTCEYCTFIEIGGGQGDPELEIWGCGHPDGSPEQPADPAGVWECKNFTRRVVVVNAEDPVECCRQENCHLWVGPGGEGDAAGCEWEGGEINLDWNEAGLWLKHPACLERDRKIAGEIYEALKEVADTIVTEARADESRCVACTTAITLEGAFVKCSLPADVPCPDVVPPEAPAKKSRKKKAAA